MITTLLELEQTAMLLDVSLSRAFHNNSQRMLRFFSFAYHSLCPIWVNALSTSNLRNAIVEAQYIWHACLISTPNWPHLGALRDEAESIS